ncbi:hypothetical protein PWYN_01015 [Paenibacillus wynnii]|uniref:MazF family transcriptional regulator n=1 Tax=Paenibacillus wynnii TaxID=268407 RepID=A0A098MFF9_9BACL|nr:hypothetical protein PWYN_01015 [Paenibacillus wynnii]
MRNRRKLNELRDMRQNAKHGDFYFAVYTAINQPERNAPVFIVGDDDRGDVVVCSCTKSPPRPPYDIKVQLKLPTSVRTSKLYTISREQLQFKIPQTASVQEYKDIMLQLSKFLHM